MLPQNHSLAGTRPRKPFSLAVKWSPRLLVLVGVLLLTGLFCAAPHFHPEAILGLSYRWWLDALFHGGYYFVATLALYVLLGKSRRGGWLWVSLLALSWALEGAQGWIPGRSLSLLDMASNTVGISGGMVLGRWNHEGSKARRSTKERVED